MLLVLTSYLEHGYVRSQYTGMKFILNCKCLMVHGISKLCPQYVLWTALGQKGCRRHIAQYDFVRLTNCYMYGYF